MKKGNKNAIKGRNAEKKVAKNLNAKRKAGPNSPDLKKGRDRVEVKKYQNPMNTSQLKAAHQQNKAQIIVSTSGYTKEAIEHAKVNMPTVQLRSGAKGQNIDKRRRNK